jgi:hypothetical protein
VDSFDICVEFLSFIVSRRREVSLSRLKFEICLLILDVVSDRIPIVLPISRLLLDMVLLLRPAAGCCVAFGGGVRRGPITLPILESARSIELLRFLMLPAGCSATLEGGVLFVFLTLSIIERLRFIWFVVDNFLVLDVEFDCVPIMLPIFELLLELIRLFKSAAGCLATVGEDVLSVPNMLLIREFIRVVELVVG